METRRFKIESFRVTWEQVKITLVLKWGNRFFSDDFEITELKMGYGSTIKGCVSGCKQKFELHRARTDGGSSGF